MKLLWVSFLLLLFLNPCLAKGDVTKPSNFISAHYTILFSPDRNTYGEGVLLSYSMGEKRTKISFGFNHTTLDETLPETELTGIGVGITGEVAGLPVDVDINLGGISYTSKRSGSMFDVLLLGEYNYLDWAWGFGSGDSPKKRHQLQMWAGVGAKIDVSIENTEYSLYVDGELFDTLENPLSHSRTSKLKFLIAHDVSYRFSLLSVGVHTVLSVPTVKKSFVLLSFGVSL